MSTVTQHTDRFVGPLFGRRLRRLVGLISLGGVLVFTGSSAAAQAAPTVDDIAAALRRDAVYVDPSAERALSESETADLRAEIADAGTPVFVAVLPEATLDQAGGDPEQLVEAVADATGLGGTYAVVVGDRFRAGSTLLPRGRAGELATTAFQAHADDGTYAVLSDFVDRVRRTATDTGGSTGSGSGGSDDDGGGIGIAPFVIAGGAGVLGVFAWRRAKRRKAAAAERARAEEADRQLLRAELAVLGEDVLRLEAEVALHPEAQADYDAAVSRYRVAQAALEYADQPVDLVRVQRVVNEARYSMDRARALIAGREPPPPPEELQRPGPHGEPAIALDDQRQPTYVGYPGPFQSGWFGGGGGGLFTGLLLGSVLGGFGGWGHGNVYIDDRDQLGQPGGGEGDGDWSGGGDWGDGGDFGGGDFGGGDFGGGDFGGGDF